MIEVIKNTKIDFMGKRKVALAVSSVFIVLGLIAIIQVARGEANLGIDFAGGTSVQIKFNTPVKLLDVRQTLTDAAIEDFDLQGCMHQRILRPKVICRLLSS